MKSTRPPLLPGKVFHLYNHAIGIENLFREDRNYPFFLNKYQQYATPICRTFSYALLPNHFHFLVQIRSQSEIAALMPTNQEAPSPEACASFVMQQFSNFFNAYAKSFNKLYKRRGRLFVEYLERKPIENNAYFQHTVLYHHFNAVRHDFCQTPLEYRYSSYHAYLCDQPTLIERETVIRQFGGRAAFMTKHQNYNCRIVDNLDF